MEWLSRVPVCSAVRGDSVAHKRGALFFGDGKTALEVAANDKSIAKNNRFDVSSDPDVYVT